jgi:hypothetical protein
MVTPLFNKFIKFTITPPGGVPTSYECAITSAAITSAGGEKQELNALCPTGAYSNTAERTYSVTITAAQDVVHEDSLLLFLWEHVGEKAEVVYFPSVNKQGGVDGYGWKGVVTLAAPDQIGGGNAGEFATFTVEMGFDGTPVRVDPEGNPVTMDKAQSVPGKAFPAEATVTGEDSTNAAKLGPLGYTAVPTDAWPEGTYIRVGSYKFHWNGTEWTAGAAPAAP